MRKIIFCFLIAIFFIVFIFSSHSSADFKKTKIAVLDFQLQGEKYETADMGKIVAEWLITALVKEGRFDVVERRLLEKLMEELKFGVSGLADENSVSKLGRQLGAKIVITGSVMKFQNIIEANARIIEVESGSIIAAESVKSTSTARLEDLVFQMAEKIIKDFPLEGYIVQREQNKVLIDLGKRAGVRTGMQFMVYKEGKVIKHPKTGEILEVEKIDTGTIEVKNVKEKTSDGIITNETASNSIQTGQLVKSTVELIPPEIMKPNMPEKPFTESEKMPDTNLQARLNAIDPQIEELKQMKASGNSAWKIKFKNIAINLKTILAWHKTSPEVYLYYAKVYYAADEISTADKLLKKAFYYRPQYIDAHIFRGDMYYEYAKKFDPGRRRDTGYDITARDAYQAALKNSQDRDLQAMMYLKIGNVYADVADDKENAKDYWQKAVSTAPGSKAAQLATERLRSQ